ncbi:MAG: carbon starvation protein A [Elusimicrobiaceae bacterium]|nr:carbon starvation protein A [Elusimicrobiaceae bacterium]
MISFFTCLALLILSYFTYAKYVEHIFGPTKAKTSAVRLANGVDYVPMPLWRMALVQLLNIAGLGPVFGAISGALWGPSVFLWITLGTIFAGAVHDFACGFLSLRHDGQSIAEVTGVYLGPRIKDCMRVFSVILLVMVGTVFAVGPANLLVFLFKGHVAIDSIFTNAYFWLTLIFLYYFLATFLPIDKIIGRFYPLFGICLLLMAVGVCGGLFMQGYRIPEITFHNLHPSHLPVWPLMFVTVACGAISGFHATQSPLMARCITSEYQSRQVFAGAMIMEGIIALIWAAAGCAVYEKTGGLMTGLQDMLAHSGQAGAVYDICLKTIGPLKWNGISFGLLFVMIGVIICPITSGDTAFRASRLVLADWFKIDQKPFLKRLRLSIPLLLAGVIISQLPYDVIWRYFSWSNQTLAMIVLWTATVYLYRKKRNYFLALVPAVFMTAVSGTYFLIAPECLHLPAILAWPAGLVLTGIITTYFLITMKKEK